MISMTTSTPWTAGLGFCVAMEKPDFLGKKAALAQTRGKQPTRLVTVVVDSPDAPRMIHDEPIFSAGRQTGADDKRSVGASIGWQPSDCFRHPRTRCNETVPPIRRLRLKRRSALPCPAQARSAYDLSGSRTKRRSKTLHHTRAFSSTVLFKFIN